MARLIDADDILPKTFICDEVAEVRKFIEQAPTVDAVEVVRCKDCRFYEGAESSLIGKLMCCTEQGDVRIQKQANDFCSYGERKNNERTD